MHFRASCSRLLPLSGRDFMKLCPATRSYDSSNTAFPIPIQCTLFAIHLHLCRFIKRYSKLRGQNKFIVVALLTKSSQHSCKSFDNSRRIYDYLSTKLLLLLCFHWVKNCTIGEIRFSRRGNFILLHKTRKTRALTTAVRLLSVVSFVR